MARIREIAEDVGKGLLAGAVGTAAMTISSTIEEKLSGREPSEAPAQAAGKVLLEVSSPPWEWGAEALAIDGLHHAVYAGATGIAYELIDRG